MSSPNPYAVVVPAGAPYVVVRSRGGLREVGRIIVRSPQDITLYVSVHRVYHSTIKIPLDLGITITQATPEDVAEHEARILREWGPTVEALRRSGRPAGWLTGPNAPKTTGKA